MERGLRRHRQGGVDGEDGSPARWQWQRGLGTNDRVHPLGTVRHFGIKAVPAEANQTYEYREKSFMTHWGWIQMPGVLESRMTEMSPRIIYVQYPLHYFFER